MVGGLLFFRYTFEFSKVLWPSPIKKERNDKNPYFPTVQWTKTLLRKDEEIAQVFYIRMWL